jgi:hypothetical protein
VGEQYQASGAAEAEVGELEEAEDDEEAAGGAGVSGAGASSAAAGVASFLLGSAPSPSAGPRSSSSSSGSATGLSPPNHLAVGKRGWAARWKEAAISTSPAATSVRKRRSKC